MSWDTIANLFTDLSDAAYGGSVTVEANEDFWKASKQKILNALAIAQQGSEFILKGKICEISPFLLIANGPREWPNSYAYNDIEFADFKTIDAQDLIKLHNTVSSTRLNDDFIEKFNDLRIKRNAIIHTIDKRVELYVTDVIVEILTLFKQLFPAGNWLNVRRKFLNESHVSKLYSIDWVEVQVIHEMSIITDMLKPSELKKFFGFNKKQRRYICPECQNIAIDSGILPRTALLKPNNPDSENLYCFVCNNDIPIKRIECGFDDCKGNVYSAEYDVCTTCGYGQ